MQKLADQRQQTSSGVGETGKKWVPAGQATINLRGLLEVMKGDFQEEKLTQHDVESLLFWQSSTSGKNYLQRKGLGMLAELGG